jgi:hypothetical protein
VGDFDNSLILFEKIYFITPKYHKLNIPEFLSTVLILVVVSEDKIEPDDKLKFYATTFSSTGPEVLSIL